MTSSDDGGDRLRPVIWADVCAECLGVRLAMTTLAGAVFPVGGVVNATTSTGKAQSILGQATAALRHRNLLEGVVVKLDSVVMSHGRARGLGQKSELLLRHG
jgi:hypothetical protein